MAIDRNKVTAAAQKYIQKGAFTKAIKEYKLIMKEFPDDVRTLLKIGDLEARAGLPADAARTYNEVADYYVAHGFFPKAVAAYKLLLSVQPDNVDAKLRLADLHYQLGLLRDALANFADVASIYMQRGQTEAYLRILMRIVEIDPDNPGNRIKLAEELARFGDESGAAEQFLLAAATLKRTARFEEYARVMERYVHVQPHDLQRVHDLARVYLQQNKPKRALVRIQSVLRDDPRNPETVDILVRSLEQLGERSRAVAVLEELAAAFDGDGAVEARNEMCRRILTFDPRHALACATLGVTPAESEAQRPPVPTEAPATPAAPQAAPQPPPRFDHTPIDVLAIGQAIELSPEEQAEVDKLLSECDVYLKYNLFERALGHLNKVFAIDPLHVGALERRKDALMATGQRELAVSVLVGLARETGPTDIKRAQAYLREALAAIPGHAIATAVLNDLGRPQAPAPAAQPATAAGAPSSPATPVASGPTTPVPVPPPLAGDGFERLDALFSDFAAEDTAVGKNALDPASLSSIPDDGNVISLATDDFLPEELDAGISLVDALIEGGDYDNARTTLFELLGEFPEHAEHLLRRMDALPSEAATGGFDAVDSGVYAPLDEAPGESEDEALLTFSIEDDDGPASEGDSDLPADIDFLDDDDEAAAAAGGGAADDLDLFDDDDDSQPAAVRPSLDDALAAFDAPDLRDAAEFVPPHVTSPHEALARSASEDSPLDAFSSSDTARGPVTERSLPAIQTPAQPAPFSLGSAETAPIEIPTGPLRPGAVAPTPPRIPPSTDAPRLVEPAITRAPQPAAAAAPERRRDPLGALDRLIGASGSFARVSGSFAAAGEAGVTASHAAATAAATSPAPKSVATGQTPTEDDLDDLDDLEVLVELDDIDDDFDDLDDVGDDLEPVDGEDASDPAGDDDRVFEAQAAEAAASANVDAPIGRASSIVASTFGPSDVALRGGDEALAEAIAQRRSGNGMMAMLTLQDAEQGPHGQAAAFELALANIELGLYFEGISALEQLLGAPDMHADDRVLIHYHLGIAYEAMDQGSLADANLRVAMEYAPEAFPDVYIRLRRLSNPDASA